MSGTAIKARRAIHPKAGDRVVFERPDGLFDVENIVERHSPTEHKFVFEGDFDPGWNDPEHPLTTETVKRRSLKRLQEAYEIAFAHMEPRGHVWVRHHASPNSLELYHAYRLRTGR